MIAVALIVIGLILLLMTVYNVLGLILLILGIVLLFVVPVGPGPFYGRRRL